MAELNINIINPKINLITNETSSSNSCASIFEFQVNTIPGNQITIRVTRTNGNPEDYDFVGIEIGGQWQLLSDGSNTYTLPTGSAVARVVIGNVSDNIIVNGAGTCNEVGINVKDDTSGEYTFRRYSRCSTQERCPTFEYENSIPSDNNTVIDPDTNILIYVDGSGSMDGTVQPLIDMRNTTLKTALLPYYNNNETTYNSKVQVIEIDQIADPAYERTFNMLNYEGQNLTGKVVCIVFQDEADLYTGPTTFSPYENRTATYDEDLSAFRQRLLSFGTNQYFGKVMQVEDTSLDGTNFKALLSACKTGTGKYAGVNGLSDKSNVKVNYDITDGGSVSYYTTLVTNTLEEFGFTV